MSPTGRGANNVESDSLPIPAEGATHAIDGSLLLDMVTGRVRVVGTDHRPQFASPGRAVMVAGDQVAVYDGHVHRYFRPERTNPILNSGDGREMMELWIYPNAQQILFGVQHDPLLFTCGALYFTERIEADNLRVPIDPEQLRIDNDSVSRNGRNCIVLRTTPYRNGRYYEYWVDAEDPRMIVQFNACRLQQELEIWLSTSIEYRDSDWGPVPDHWTTVKYDFRTGKPETYEVRLDEIEANPVVTDADFEIEAPPGTRVYDATRPRGDQYYVVAAAGQPNLPVGEFVLQEEQFRYRMWMYLGIAGVVVVVIAAVVVKRRRLV